MVASTTPDMFNDPTLPPPPWCDTCCPGCPDTKKDGVLMTTARQQPATLPVMNRPRQLV
jgi:hypothetical protein